MDADKLALLTEVDKIELFNPDIECSRAYFAERLAEARAEIRRLQQHVQFQWGPGQQLLVELQELQRWQKSARTQLQASSQRIAELKRQLAEARKDTD